MHVYDLVILGGGPAGMTAALYAARANLRVILLETAITGGLVNSTYTVENFPSYPEIHGMELMEKFRAHIDHLNIPVEEVFEITGLDLEPDLKIVHGSSATYQSKAMILATGRRPVPLTVPPDVPVECAQLHHCAICDGAPYKDKKVLIAGGGNSAFDESLYLLHLGVKQLTIVEAMDSYFAAQSTQDALFADPRTHGYTGTRIVDVRLENNVLVNATLETIATKERFDIPTDGIFVFLGQKPNNEWFKESVKLNDHGYVIVTDDMATNIPGVFSAGDINHKAYRQITTAIADGTIAALAAERWVRTREVEK